MTLKASGLLGLCIGKCQKIHPEHALNRKPDKVKTGDGTLAHDGPDR